LNYFNESKAKQNLYIQNCEYIKEEVTRFSQRLDYLKNKLNTEKCEKEIILSSSGLVTTTRVINLERWIYLRDLPEKTKTLASKP
jgi:hypothetical protein